MPRAQGHRSRATALGRAARVVTGVALAALIASGIADRRGWALGGLAFLMYGSLAVAGALSFAGLRRWSADHVVLDSSLLVPLTFFALLLVPALSWWAAALIALAGGALVVPFAIRRRTAQQATAQSRAR